MAGPNLSRDDIPVLTDAEIALIDPRTRTPGTMGPETLGRKDGLFVVRYEGRIMFVEDPLGLIR